MRRSIDVYPCSSRNMHILYMYDTCIVLCTCTHLFRVQNHIFLDRCIHIPTYIYIYICVFCSSKWEITEMFHGCTPTVMVLASKVGCKQRMLVDTVRWWKDRFKNCCAFSRHKPSYGSMDMYGRINHPQWSNKSLSSTFMGNSQAPTMIRVWNGFQKKTAKLKVFHMVWLCKDNLYISTSKIHVHC